MTLKSRAARTRFFQNLSQSEFRDATQIVIVGGSAAGPKAAARARRLDPTAFITLVEREETLSMASCGLPFYVSGAVSSRTALLESASGALRDPAYFFNTKSIVVHTGTEAVALNRLERQLTVRERRTGTLRTLPYDKLLLATGAKVQIPPLPGRGLPGVIPLRTLPHGDAIRARVERGVRRAVVLGSGLVGLETCEALTKAGVEITLIEREAQLLPPLEWQLSGLLLRHLQGNGVAVRLGSEVVSLEGTHALQAVTLRSGERLPCELMVVATGVTPNSELARAAGLRIGPRGGIQVDRFLRTSDRSIYAAGDCVEVRNQVSGLWDYAPKGDLANLEGRIAADNMLQGNRVPFPGTQGTAIGEFFSFTVGTTGLTEEAAHAAGFQVESVCNVSTDKPHFMPQARLLVSTLVAERSTGRLLGFQCVGKGDVSRQVSQAAVALKGGLTISQLQSLDLPYAPPFSQAVDHFLTSVHLMENKLAGRLKGVSGRALKALLTDSTPRPTLIDVRDPHEYDAYRLNQGELLLPLGQLRRRLNELPPRRETPLLVTCLMGSRAYEASLVLQEAGYTNVQVMEGGLLGWPLRPKAL